MSIIRRINNLRKSSHSLREVCLSPQSAFRFLEGLWRRVLRTISKPLQLTMTCIPRIFFVLSIFQTTNLPRCVKKWMPFIRRFRIKEFIMSPFWWTWEITSQLMKSSSVFASSKWLRKSRDWWHNSRIKRSLTTRLSAITLSSWPSSRLRRESFKRRPREFVLRTLAFATRSARLPSRLSPRRRRLSKNTRKVLKNTQPSSAIRPAVRKRILPLSRISIRKSKIFTRKRCRTCRISLQRRPRRWRSQRDAGNLS